MINEKSFLPSATINTEMTFQAYPSNSISDKPMKQSRFKQTEYRDLWAFILFYIISILYYGISVYLIHLQVPDEFKNFKKIFIFYRMFLDIKFIKLRSPLIVSILISILFSIVLTILTIFLLFWNPIAFIQGSLVGMIILNLFISLLHLIIGLWTGFNAQVIISSISGLIIPIILTIFYFAIRKRIPFSAIILKNVIEIFRIYPSSIGLSVLSSIFQIISLAIFMVAIPGIRYLEIARDNNTASIFYLSLLICFLFLGFAWQIGTIINVIQTTVAGVVATVLLTSSQIVNPTLKAFKRSVTISFGSIAFGSLLVTIVQIFRFIFRSLERNRGFPGAMANCFSRWFENLLKYFNYYVYTYIAMYGNSYIQSSKQVYHLIKENGMEAIINDNLIGTVFGLLAVIIGISSGLIGFFIFQFSLENIKDILFDSRSITALLFMNGFIVIGIACIIIPIIMFEVFKSAATAIFVCYVEESQAIEMKKPDLFRELRIKDVEMVA